MELTKDESKRILRRIELEAYSALVTALRAQGELDREKKRLLRELGEQLSISTERHRAEIRRAISDDRLSMIAECVCGSDASVEWESEGRRVVPLMPRLVPQTAFTGTATAAANHAASVNSTISSSLKGRTKDRDEEEDAKTRKRQRTTSPKPVQKVIVSSIHKTTTQRDAVSTVTSAAHSANVTPKETAKFVRTSTFPTKQENSSSPLSSVSMKINSSHSGSSGHQIISKPIILGGSKSTSSVSVASAANKNVARLPESCLQAHASVVSGNKNRTKLNLVKQKPKPKFKPLSATVKIKTLSPVRQNAIALQLPSTDKTKANEVSTSISKTIQAPRITASITVPPRSSISLTTFKNSLQQKPKSQSPPGIVRNIETTSRHASGQLTKGSPVSRLSRPLPAILPKSIPPKSISTVSSPGRKLASILPAPAKSTTSTLPHPVKLPVVASSSTTSPPIPIAPSPRPPQSFHGLCSTVLSKVSSVSLTSKPSSVLKSDIRETCTAPYKSESAVSSAVLPETATVGSKNYSPSLSSKSKESIHERETLSPVSDILTLVTSPSSVPYVSSSPVKSKALTTRSALNEISLKCNEKLSEVKDFLKEEEVELEGLRSLFDAFPSSSTKLPQEGGGSQIPKTSLRNDNLQTLNKPDHNILQLSQGSRVKAVPTEVCLQKPEKQDTKVTQEISDVLNKTKDVASSGVDLSPLVNELLSDNSLLTQEKHLEDTSAVPNPPFSVRTTPSIACKVTNKVVEHWTGFESALLDVQESEQINVKNTACLNLEIIEEKSDIAYKDNVDTSVKKDIDQLALTTKDIEEQGKIDHIQSQKETELKDDDPKVVIQMEETVDFKSKEVIRELPVAEKENSTQVDKLSHLKKQQKPIEMVINATEHAEKSDESSVLDSEKENENSIIKGDLESLEKTNSLKDNINSDISVITVTEKVVGLDETRLLETEKLDENLQLNKMESAQLSVSATKPVEKLSDSSTWEQKTESEFLDCKTTETIKQAVGNSLTIDEKDNDQFFVGPIKNQRLLDGASKATKSEVPLSVPDSSLSRSLCGSISSITESLTTEHQVENPSKDYDTGSRQESGEEQHSGSDTGSTEGAFIRTSGRKRKAPPPRDFSLAAHPPGWIRGALLLLQRVSRFRGNARLKGEPSAASWFLKPVETADAPGYHKIVKNPMDFGTIKSKLETAKYRDHTQFHSDMLLVKTNCYKYNPPGHDVRRDCDEVFQFYEVEYEKFSEKLEKCHLFSPKKARPLFGGNESK